jgi:Bacterial antitoxin of ParD toxin-antitoxin type II system and RHH
MRSLREKDHAMTNGKPESPIKKSDEVKLEELRRALIEGEESGVAGPFDFEAFIARKGDAPR